MKANRKFLNDDDEAVSPVIAVILMVAITVVLAATVYVWVSGFGSNSSKPANTMALTSGGALGTPAAGQKPYVVASASPGLKWGDMKFTLDGALQSITAGGVGITCAAPDTTAATYTPCGAGSIEASSGLVDAGDTLYFNVASGQTLRVLDAGSNSIILTLTVQ